MGHDEGTYVRDAHGNWHASETDVVQLSRGAYAVAWTLETSTDTISIRCFHDGVVVRELSYADRRWRKTGKRLPFEHASVDKWLKKRDVLATPDGYDVIQCVLGKDRPPADLIVEAGPSPQSLFLPKSITRELTALAERYGATRSAILLAAWELGKTAMYERALPHAPAPIEPGIVLEPPDPPRTPPAFVHDPVEVAPLVRDEQVKITLSVPPVPRDEVARIAMELDRSLSWCFREAYEIARERLV